MEINNNFFTSKGRMQRGPFIAASIIFTVLAYIGAVFMQATGNMDLAFYGTPGLIIRIISICIACWAFWRVVETGKKRLRDLKANTSLMWLALIPGINVLLWLWLAVAPSKWETEELSYS